jgi:hypothetical protein
LKGGKGTIALVREKNTLNEEHSTTGLKDTLSVCLCIYVCICMYVCVYVSMCICMCICMCVYLIMAQIRRDI